ncbi:MAG: hypothetical protein WBO10_10975 [Pyrinomonadaceae bacterium]
MSKNPCPLLLISAAFVLILQFFTYSPAQELDVRIKIVASEPTSADIRVNLPSADAGKNSEIWYLDEYAGVAQLVQRLSPIYFYDRQGYLFARKSIAVSDTFKTANVGGIGYLVDLTPRPGSTAAGHVSWVNTEGGILFLDDLLPQALAKTARIKLELPEGWKAASTDYSSSMDQSEPSGNDRNSFTVSNPEKSVIFVGPADRRRVVWSGKARLVLNQRGDWQFSTDEALSTATSIFANYEKSFGSRMTGSFLIGMSKFPNAMQLGNWEADTRGRTVTIVSSDMPFKSQSMQRLHEQLRHEMFHLWIPNSVNLTGNYDWFYEGFALYRSLKLGVAVNRIRFNDYLDTLSRAYIIDSMRSQQLSLIDLSRNRWIGSNTQVYARGMLLAFLCDVAMLDASKGKRSVDDLLREIYARHGGTASPTDANAAVTTIMKQHKELLPLVERYIVGREKLDWSALITAAGIAAETRYQLTTLKVVRRPSGRQKDLLDKLGYNSWRKLSNEEQ